MEWWDAIKDWFLGLGKHYHVNPLVFGSIYIGAIPFFFASLYWTINNIRNKKPYFIPSVVTGFFFISAYLYLVIVGKHIPVWVYFFLALLILYGVYSTLIKIKAKTKKVYFNAGQMLSIIIPTFNEAERIVQTISNARAAVKDYEAEIIVVDGGSLDETRSVAKSCGAITIKSERKGRAAQLNLGAFMAKGEILYFLHADSVPPIGFIISILYALKTGAISGCFRLAFDCDNWFLKANCWFTRFNVNAVRFGDQSLFVTKEVFDKTGGFRENLMIMEDQEIIHRIKKHGKFVVMNDVVVTSARKYLDNGVYRTQVIFFWIWLLYYLGYSQQHLLKLHKRLIYKNKL